MSLLKIEDIYLSNAHGEQEKNSVRKLSDERYEVILPGGETANVTPEGVVFPRETEILIRTPDRCLYGMPLARVRSRIVSTTDFPVRISARFSDGSTIVVEWKL